MPKQPTLIVDQIKSVQTTIKVMKVGVNVKQFYSKLNAFFSHQDDPFKGVDNLISMEETAKRMYAITHGYPEVNPIKGNDSHYGLAACSPVSILIEISLYLTLTRFSILSCTNNHSLNFYFGDIYVGTSTRFYMNGTFLVGGWLVIILRSMLFWSEIYNKASWLSFFTLIKSHGFNSSFLNITPSGSNQLRTKVYLCRKFMTIACTLSVVAISGMLFVPLLNNLAHRSRKAIFFQFFWSIVISIQLPFVVYAAIWLVVHLYLLNCYCSLQLDAIKTTIDQLLPSSTSHRKTFFQSYGIIKTTHNQINSLVTRGSVNKHVQSLVASQNYTANYIMHLSDQVKYYLAVAYFYASFGADYLLYAASVMPTDYLFNNIAVAGAGIEVFVLAMVIILVLSKVSVKASSLYGKYHSIIGKLKPEVTVQRKVLSEMSAISDSFIGFYIGDVFGATMYQYVEFLLGNCSFMLLMIGMLQKIT